MTPSIPDRLCGKGIRMKTAIQGPGCHSTRKYCAPYGASGQLDRKGLLRMNTMAPVREQYRTLRSAGYLMSNIGSESIHRAKHMTIEMSDIALELQQVATITASSP